MRILAIESSAVTASVAILEDDTLVAEYTINHKMTHSQTLLPMIDEIFSMVQLKPDDVDVIAVSKGVFVLFFPVVLSFLDGLGSFTSSTFRNPFMVSRCNPLVRFVRVIPAKSASSRLLSHSCFSHRHKSRRTSMTFRSPFNATGSR